MRIKYFYEARTVIHELQKMEIDSTTETSLWFIYYINSVNRKMASDAGFYFSSVKDNNFFSSKIYFMMSRRIVDDELSLINKNTQINALELDSLVSPQFSEFYKFNALSIKSTYRDYKEVEELEDMKGFRNRTLNYITFYGRQKYRDMKIDDALTFLSYHEKLHPKEPYWHLELAKVYSHTGVTLIDESERLLEKALSVNPNYKAAYSELLRMFMWKKKYQKAYEVTQKYKQFEAYPDLALQTAIVYGYNKKMADALDLIEKNIGYASESLVYFEKFYEIIERFGSDNELGKFINLVEANSKDKVDIIIFLSKYYAEIKNYEKVLNLCQSVLAKESDNIYLKAEISRAKYYTGKKAEAIAEFEEQNKSFKTRATIGYYYSQVLADEGTDLKLAASFANLAVSVSSGGIKETINLCYIYSLEGRFDLCLGNARKASSVHKDIPEFFYYIGYSLYQLKRDNYQEISKEKLQKALDLGLRGSLKDDCLELLSKL
jgi:tetratricopeptide (TPR) repeat protein